MTPLAKKIMQPSPQIPNTIMQVSLTNADHRFQAKCVAEMALNMLRAIPQKQILDKDNP